MRRPRRDAARTTALERCVARLLVLAIVAMTPATGFAGEEFGSADQAVMLTPGEIDNATPGLTVIRSNESEGVTDWRGGFDQPVGNTTVFDLTAEGAQHLNLIGGDEAAFIRGTILSGADDTILIASPNGLFIGPTAIVNVGELVAVGADLTDPDRMGIEGIELAGAILNQGVIQASQDVLLYGTHVVNAGEIYTPAGRLLMLGADAIHFLDADTITEGLLDPIDFVALLGTSGVQNLGSLTAESAALIGRRVLNAGHIEIADGTLMIFGGDAVHLRRFDDPVVITLPQADRPANAVEAPRYAVENRGTIDAGRGRVRLAAADPLGWGIRQRAEPGGISPSISAGAIELAGGEHGRVEIAGRIDASDRDAGAVGGSIEVTGETIVLVGSSSDDADDSTAEAATLLASGDTGGGTIHVGGDEQGKGERQRARGLIVAEGSQVRADALRDGDGGRVILFAESLTHIAGAVSATGGRLGGDGGFVETSGLARLSLETTPDLSAPQGQAGHWLIDPYSITLVAETGAADPDCPALGDPCLNKAVEAILDPAFDSAGFDDILRTVDPSESTLGDPNAVSVALLARALAVGTDVTLSTEAFDPDGADQPEVPGLFGDIDVDAAILIPDGAAAPGTRATLTLLAAGSIHVNADIRVGSGDDSVTPDMVLDVVLTANDQDQRDPNADFDQDRLQGDVDIDADIRTGGGDFAARGIRVTQSAGRTLETDGGAVFLQSGSVDRFGNVATFVGTAAAPAPILTNTGIDLDGTIDTARPADDGAPGGGIALQAGSVNVRRPTAAGTTELSVEAGLLDVSGALRSGGGAIALRGGGRGTTSAGNVRLDGATVDSGGARAADSDGGGVITIDANRLSPDDPQLANFAPVFPATPDAEGGVITLAGANDVDTAGGNLVIGSTRAQRVEIEGDLDTTGGANGEDGLLGVLAGDESGRDPLALRFGAGAIVIGGSGAASLRSGGITLQARDVLTSVAGAANPVSIVATGAGRGALPESVVGLSVDLTVDDGPFVETGLLQVEAARQAVFEQNTLLRANGLEVTTARIATELSETERTGADPDFDPFTRLVFGGSGGAVAADGVRVEADTVTLRTAAAYATTSDVSAPILDEGGVPTDIAIQRQSQGDYRGLQLRSQDGLARPEAVSIEQAAGLAVEATPATAESQLYFGGRSGGGGSGGVFDTAAIGANGQRITLTSYAGPLAIGDATGLDSDVVPGAGDAGRSWVTLNGGLLLPPNDTDNAVTFAGIAAPFEVEGLSITSPRSFTVTTDLASAILSANELSITAGLPTGLEDTSFAVAQLGGTLTVEAGLTLSATDRLALFGGASGVGDLVFAPPGGTATRLEANAIVLAAGAGRAGLNTDPATRSEIEGAAEVEFRDAAGAAFVADATQKSFSFRQDAAIDAATHLPTLDDFGIASGGFGTGGERVDYALRSDFGGIDLTSGGFDASQVEGVDISLIGTEVGGAPAVLVPAAFVFDGRSVVLGGTVGFRYTQTLADAFAPAGVAAAADKELTLRAGSNAIGALTFESGVVVRAPHVRLVAGDGEGGDFGARVLPSGAMFDLSDGAADARSFVFHEDETFFASDLPTIAQFVESGGAPVLPSSLAIRNDSGRIDWTNPDFTALPLELGDALNPGRLVLETANLTLTANFPGDLELTSDSDPLLANLRLRLRSDQITLAAINGSDASGGRVLAGERVGDDPDAIGPGADGAFDGERLLIEGFQVDADATTGNLSALSEVEGSPGTFDLATARGPSTITIRQDGDITSDELPDRWNIAGHLARSQQDDAEGDPVRTALVLDSNFGAIDFDADNVSGSDLTIGASFDPVTGDVFVASGDYVFGNLQVFSAGDITLESDSDLVGDRLQLQAGLLLDNPSTAVSDMGDLIFEGAGLSSLTANTLILRAGPTFRVTNPDSDGDGIREAIGAAAAGIDWTGLGEIGIADANRGSLLVASSTADLDTTQILVGLVAGGDVFRFVDLASIQAQTLVTDGGLTANGTTASLAAHADASRLGSDETDATLVVEVNGSRADPFSIAAGWNGNVELRSNDITIRAADGVPQLQLDDPNLRITSRTTRTGFEPGARLARVASDPDVLDRPRLTIEQGADFSTTRLPRLDRYFQRGFGFGESTISTERRTILRAVEIELVTRGSSFVFGDDLRNGVIGANLVIRGDGSPTSRLDLAIQSLRPGVGDYVFESLTDLRIEDNPALDLASFEATGFDLIAISAFTPVLATDNLGGSAPTRIDFGVTTFGDQLWDGRLALGETLDAQGRDLRFTNDVFRAAGAPADIDLVIQTRGAVAFEDDIGIDGEPVTDGDTPLERLRRLFVFFDDDADGRVQFGRRQDVDGDTIAEQPIASDQNVFVDEDIVFAALTLGEPNDPTIDGDADPTRAFRDAVAAATDLAGVQAALTNASAGRERSVALATIGKGLGDLAFRSTSGGHFVMASGERLAVGGDLTIDHAGQVVTLGDAAASGPNGLVVAAGEIGLVERNAGVTLLADGSSTQSGGAAILANTIDFGGVTPVRIGRGKQTRFGVPDPFDPALPAFLADFPVAAISPDGAPLDASAFTFLGSANLDEVASPIPLGASRSELTGAIPPLEAPIRAPIWRDLAPLAKPERMSELGIDARETEPRILQARLASAAIIDDVALVATNEHVPVTEARLNPSDAEAAIALYESLFGVDGDRAGEVRAVLQEALDRYLATTRARRVVGFELRRFVKNRPSTLLEAYTTLDRLDSLFRYHRRLGLSSGEYRAIQREWLAMIQPDGIDLDELSEAIHPSRYVRGSDILDIFGR